MSPRHLHRAEKILFVQNKNVKTHVLPVRCPLRSRYLCPILPHYDGIVVKVLFFFGSCSVTRTSQKPRPGLVTPKVVLTRWIIGVAFSRELKSDDAARGWFDLVMLVQVQRSAAMTPEQRQRLRWDSVAQTIINSAVSPEHLITQVLSTPVEHLQTRLFPTTH